MGSNQILELKSMLMGEAVIKLSDGLKLTAPETLAALLKTAVHLGEAAPAEYKEEVEILFETAHRRIKGESFDAIVADIKARYPGKYDHVELDGPNNPELPVAPMGQA